MVAPLPVCLPAAFLSVCQSRLGAGPSHDIWRLRERWDRIRPWLTEKLTQGLYRLSPVRLVDLENGHRVEVWDAEDSVVQKALSLVLSPVLQQRLSSRCYHLTDHGGAKGAIRDVRAALESGRYRHVMRSDVRGYDANIRHAPLLEALRAHTDDSVVLDLVSQYCHRTTVHRGHYQFQKKGIPLGSPLSPLMGALYLDKLDRRMERLSGIFYARFMDDWVILAPTRWKLRKAVRIVNETLAELRVEQHPDKTFIGRVDRGFDFLGHHLALATTDATTAQAPASSPGDEPATILPPSKSALARLEETVSRLYEQGADEERVGKYVERWQRWLTAALGDFDETPETGPTGSHRQGRRTVLGVSRDTFMAMMAMRTKRKTQPEPKHEPSIILKTVEHRRTGLRCRRHLFPPDCPTGVGSCRY